MEAFSVKQEQMVIHSKSDLSAKVKNGDPCVQLKDVQGKSPFCAKFARIECYGLDTNYVACKVCSVPIKYTSESGTSGLIRHKCHVSKAAPVSAPVPDDDEGAERGESPKFQDVLTSLAAKVARMCSQDLRPLSVVEGRGFAGVAQALLEIGSRFGCKFPVEGILPSAGTLARHVDEAYDQLKGRVKDEIRQCQAHAVSADLWTAEWAETRYLTVTAHYIHEWKSRRQVLATREVAEDDDDIKRTAGEILQEFGIASEDVVVVSDDALDSAFQGYTRLSCASHKIDAILQHVFDGLDEENPLQAPVIQLMAAINVLATHLKRERLEGALAPPSDNAAESGCWRSKLATLKSVNKLSKSGKLRRILPAGDQLLLQRVDSELLEQVAALLAPFDEAKRHLSSARAPTLHLVLPTKATLLKALLRRHDDSQVVAELKAKLSEAVDLKFHIDVYHKVATALSPSLRTFLRKTVSAQEYDEVVGTLARLIEKSRASEGPLDGVWSPEASEVDDFFSACIEEAGEDDEEEDGEKDHWGRQVVRQYLSDKMPPPHARSLLDFWKERSDALARPADSFLSIPASCAPAQADLPALARRRAAIHPRNVDALLFLHSNTQV
ncbi:zinc finger protein 618-like [Festucalex cinctus]